MRRVVWIAAVLAALGCSSVPAFARLVQFRTPSGNIGCVGETARAENTIRCDIRTKTWTAPPRPRSCTLDWGFGLHLSRLGRPGFVCAGDTALNAGPRLAYGTSRRIGAITCTSRVTGLTCRNAAGHGFTLSRTRVRRF